MIRSILRHLAHLLILLSLFSCNNLINGNEYKSESNIIYSKADTNYYTEHGMKENNTIRKIAVLDTVFVDAHDSLKFSTLEPHIVDTIVSNTVLGFREFEYSSVDRISPYIINDSVAIDSILQNYDAVVECVVGLEEYTYYSYLGGLFGWHWWNFPGFITKKTFRLADIYIRLGDFQNIDESGRIKMPWTLQINDLVRNEPNAVVNTKVGEYIRQGFAQSTYLQVIEEK